MRFEHKAVLKVLSANVLVLLIGIVQTLLLPSILGPKEFGYYSYYSLYTSYAGILILGMCDGFFIKQSGKKYEDLDKKEFSTYNYILFLYLLIVITMIIIGIMLFHEQDKKYYLLILVCIGTFMVDYKSYYLFINQATARFTIYAKGRVIQKIILLLATILIIFVDNATAYIIIFASIIGDLITILYFAFYSKDILSSKPEFSKKNIFETFDNIKVGFTLTLYGVSEMLMTSFGRFLIERKLGIIELGYYSLLFSVSALFTQLIYAVTTVLFPLLRRKTVEKSILFLNNLDNLIIYLSGIILVLYYPARFILQIIFPEYTSAMNVMMFIFPIIVSQSRLTLVYNISYKVLRFEKRLLLNTASALAFSVIITLLMFVISQTKESVAFSTYIGYLFYNTISIYYYNKLNNEKVKLFNIDTIICLGYILINILFGYTIISFAIVSSLVVVIFTLKFKKIVLLSKIILKE